MSRIVAQSPVTYSSRTLNSRPRMRGLDTNYATSYGSSYKGTSSSDRYSSRHNDIGSGSRFRSSSTSRTGHSTYSPSSRAYGTSSHATSHRPLPPGPGPFDRYGHKISTQEALDNIRSGRSTISQSRAPVKATNSYRSQSVARDTFKSTYPSSHGHSRGAVSEITKKFETLSTPGTSSNRLSRKQSSGTIDVNVISTTPDKVNSEKYDLFDKSSNVSTPTKSYNYPSTGTPRTYNADATTSSRLPSISNLRSRSNSREKLRKDSPDRTAKHDSLAGSRQNSTSSLNTFSSNKSSGAITRQDSLGLVGLRNLGNTCFMNSMLQCLSNTKPLLDYVLRGEYKDEINTTTSSMSGALVQEYANLMKGLWKDKEKDRYGENYLSPTILKNKIQRFAPTFTGYNQQDSQEFLIYLLEGLHQDLNRVTVKKKPIIPDEDEDNKLKPSAKALKYWERYLSRDNSKFVDIFVGQLRSCLKCTECQHESLTFDPFWDLSLPIKKHSCSLQDCFQMFTQEEVLDGDERPQCERCKKRQRCTKRFTIEKFPQILVLHLKRFSQERILRSKLDTPVDFPISQLNLSDYASNRSGVNPVYNLYGVSNHSGTPLSGHYTAHCKHPYSGEWHTFDDRRVISCSEPKGGREAYVLFYELASQPSRL